MQKNFPLSIEFIYQLFALIIIIIIVHAAYVAVIRPNADAILATEGLSGIVIGPNDLAGSMGHIGRPNHAEVGRAIDSVIAKARAAKKFVGLGCGVDPAEVRDWANRGVQWLLMGADFQLLRKVSVETVAAVKAGLFG